MLWNRIIGAFTFRKGVYAEVESDTNFTQTAWIIVAVVAFLNQLGSYTELGIAGWIVGAIIGTITTIIGFAVGAFIVNWVGRAVFNADVTFDEMVRTLGLAYVWSVVGVLGILGFIPALLCLVAPIMIIAGIAGLIAWFIAAKEALDLEWVQTIITVILGWLAILVITLITHWIVGLIF
jgi:hypothetical protein